MSPVSADESGSTSPGNSGMDPYPIRRSCSHPPITELFSFCVSSLSPTSANPTLKPQILNRGVVSFFSVLSFPINSQQANAQPETTHAPLKTSQVSLHLPFAFSIPYKAESAEPSTPSIQFSLPFAFSSQRPYGETSDTWTALRVRWPCSAWATATLWGLKKLK